jgi:hypothetical protein
MRTNARGTVLLLVLVVLLALTMLGVLVLNSSGKQLSGARHRENAVGLSSCAQAVRQFIAAQVIAGQALTSLSFSVPGTTASISLQGGHYDAIQVTAFTLPGGAPFGVQAGPSVENLANALPMGISAAAVTHTGSAVCTDANGRTYEVEFSFVSST